MCKVAVIDTGVDIGNKYLQSEHISGVCIRKTTNES